MVVEVLVVQLWAKSSLLHDFMESTWYDIAEMNVKA